MPPRPRAGFSPEYPIRAVARLTGISIDTLRTWERRYALVTPRRDGRGRLYSAADVNRLQLVAAAVRGGHAVGRLVSLGDRQLEALLADAQAQGPAPGRDTPDGPLRALSAAIDAFEFVAVERELNRLALAMPPRTLVHEVVLPLMRGVGDAWHDGRLTVGQEHLVSAAIRNLLGAMVRLYSREQPSRRVLLATLPGERHEFGVLAAAMLTAAGGLGAMYLGPDLPPKQIIDSAVHGAADVVLVGVVFTGRRNETTQHLRYLMDHLPPAMELWVGGRPPAAVGRHASSLVLLPDFQALETHLVRIGARF